LQVISFAPRRAHLGAAAEGYAGARSSVAPKKVRQWAVNSSAIGLSLRLANVASTSRLLETPTLKGLATNARPS
jgi:hypothetical protein